MSSGLDLHMNATRNSTFSLSLPSYLTGGNSHLFYKVQPYEN